MTRRLNLTSWLSLTLLALPPAATLLLAQGSDPPTTPNCNGTIPDPTPPNCGGAYTRCEDIFSFDVCQASDGKYPNKVAVTCQGGGNTHTEYCDDGEDVICYKLYDCVWVQGTGCTQGPIVSDSWITPKVDTDCVDPNPGP